jgi:mono/diheme cytochrome c family protein
MLKYFTIVVTATTLCFYSFSGITQTAPTLPKSNEKVHAGQEIFTKKCFQCHSVLEGQVRLGPSLYHELKEPHPKKSTTEVRDIIINGKGKMPPFKESLAKQDVDDLLAYIRSL